MYQLSSGAIINATFTPTTKTTMIDSIKSELVNAGWSVISGSSGGWTLESVATPTNSLKMRLTMAASTNCAQLTFKNSAASITSTTDAFLLPDSTTWRIIANNYGFWVQKDSSPTANKRDFAFGFTPYIPSFLTVTECIVGGGRCLSDSSTAACRSFRDALTHDGVNSNTGAYFTLINGSAFNAGTFETDSGTLRFRIGGSAREGVADINDSACQTFYDGTYFMCTPYIAFGDAGPSTGATCNGIVYDAVLVENSYAYGTTKTFAGYDWMAITHSNVGNSTDGLWRGTLFVRIT